MPEEMPQLDENAPPDSEKQPVSSKIKALIELKALRLLDKQKRLRSEIVSGMKRATMLQTAVSRNDYRRMKKPTLRELRHTEKMERQQRMEREKKERAKQMEYLNGILQHGRDMLAARRALSQKQMKLGRAVLHWHNTVEKEEQKRQERLTKERIKALKVRIEVVLHFR
jgi:ATP-dependent helicase STH1/SNF2